MEPAGPGTGAAQPLAKGGGQGHGEEEIKQREAGAVRGQADQAGWGQDRRPGGSERGGEIGGDVPGPERRPLVPEAPAGLATGPPGAHRCAHGEAGEGHGHHGPAEAAGQGQGRDEHGDLGERDGARRQRGRGDAGGPQHDARGTGPARLRESGQPQQQRQTPDDHAAEV